MSNKVKFKILFTFLNSIYRFSSEQHRNAEPLASESEKKAYSSYSRKEIHELQQRQEINLKKKI